MPARPSPRTNARNSSASCRKCGICCCHARKKKSHKTASPTATRRANSSRKSSTDAIVSSPATSPADCVHALSRKPISCYLYPARVKHIGDGDVVNYDRWKICRAAETLGRARGLRVYEFLRDPLTRRFGPEWYSTLAATCRLYLDTYHPHHP